MQETKEKSIQLTPSQQRAFDKFIEFLTNDTKVFILKGYAGTGKTTLLKSFIRELQKRKEEFKLLASTGRAAKIIRDITGAPASTIHSMLYVFTDLNQDLDKIYENDKEQPKMDNTGQLLLNFDMVEADNQNYSRCFYIVDESSMISDKAEENPTQAVFGSGKTLYDLLHYDSKGKFIFVGDNCQLPPVREKESPALSPEYIQINYGMKCVDAELTNIVRQDKKNGIVMASKRVRELFQSPFKPKWPLFPLKGTPNIKIGASQIDVLDKYINNLKSDGYESSTLICRSNSECAKFARFIRPALGFHGLLAVNDLLIVTQNNGLSGFVNGDMVKVTQLGMTTTAANLTFQLVEVEEVVTKRRFSQLLILDILSSNLTNLSTTQQKGLYIDFFFRMKNKGIKQKSPVFKDNMRTDPYLNALRVNYGYALTCHKAQGGEWSNVYVNIPNFLPPDINATEYQWLYTAMTRATKNLHIIDMYNRTTQNPDIHS